MPTYTRKTHLQQAGFTVIGNDYHRTFKNVTIDSRAVQQDGRSVAERHSQAVSTKAFLRFGGAVFRTVGGVRQSMLSFSVYSFGTMNLIGRLVSGRLQGNTILDEGSAGGDEYRYPIPQGTDISCQATLLIASHAEFAALMKQPISQRQLNLSMTMGGFACVLPMVLSGSVHSYDPTKNQVEDVDFALDGEINPLNVTGDPVLASAIVGSSVGSFELDTGAGTYTAVDGCVVTDFGFNFADSQLIEDNFNFQAQGEWDFSAP